VKDMNKHLLVRADFVLGRRQGGDRLVYRRWRRILVEALPRLLGCSDRCPRAERVRLHKGEGESEGRYVAWVRIPIERRPGRNRLRKLKAKLRGRLEESLRPLDGEVIKFGVRRQKRREDVLPLLRLMEVPESACGWPVLQDGALVPESPVNPVEASTSPETKSPSQSSEPALVEV
jgi:hypothetical protein